MSLTNNGIIASKHEGTTDLNDGQSDSIKHDVSAILLHDLDLLCEDAKQVNTCWGVESPVVASLGRVRPVCFQNIGVPFLRSIQNQYKMLNNHTKMSPTQC